MSLYGQVSATSGAITGDVAVSAGPCLITGITLMAGTAASSLLLYDNASAASGTKIWQISLKAETAAGDTCHSISFPEPLNCANGCYVDWTGVAAVGYVSYIPQPNK